MMTYKHKKSYFIKFYVQTSITEEEGNMLRVNDLRTDGIIETVFYL